MNTVKAAICSTITEDDAEGGFQSLTGATSGDKRLFKAWPPVEPIITAAEVFPEKPAYVIYRFATQAGATEMNAEQEGDIMLMFDVFSKKEDTATSIKERLKALLHGTQITTASKIVLTVLYTGSNLFFEIDRRLFHDAITFELSNILSK